MSDMEVLHDFASWLNGFPQEALAATMMLIGAALVARGFAVAKILVITSMSLVAGNFTYVRSETFSQPVALVASVLMASLVFEISHRLYPLLVFLLGCIVGGVTAGFCAFHVSLDLHGSPSSLLGFTVLASVFGGLLFRSFRNIAWRFLTPLLGAFSLAAAFRFFMAELFSNDGAKVSDVVAETSDLQHVAEQPLAVLFVVSWVVGAAVGWYSQLANYFGDEDPLALSDEWLETIDRLLIRFPHLLDRQAEIQKFHSLNSVSSSGSMEPLLARSSSGALLKPQNADYRPEAAVILAVLSVLVLNYFLASKPLLLLGHVILMSSAFLPFLTAGLVSYGSRNGVLPGFFGPLDRDGPFVRHFTHGTFNSLALVAAALGYACIYANHNKMGASQFGLDPGNTWNRILHVWNGYLVLSLMLLQCGSGIVKLVGRLAKKNFAPFHGTLGRWIYVLAACNQMLGYFFKDFIPLWGALLLSVMLAAIVSATIFLLDARKEEQRAKEEVLGPDPVQSLAIVAPTEALLPKSPRKANPYHQMVTYRLDSLRTAKQQNAITKQISGSDAGAASSSSGSGKLLPKWEAVLDHIEKTDCHNLLKKYFSDWHRYHQSIQLDSMKTDLQGSENLVNFLSAQMVNGQLGQAQGA